MRVNMEIGSKMPLNKLGKNKEKSLQKPMYKLKEL